MSISIRKKIWQDLCVAKKQLEDISIKSLMSSNSQRFDEFSLQIEDLFFDYSKQRIDSNALQLLYNLADQANIQQARKAMFAGDIINNTEQRSVLHTALRDLSDKAILVNGENVKPLIKDVLQRMEIASNKIRNNLWLGYNNKPINTIVNIGIGGSDLGPAMVVEALKPYALRSLNCYFVSNIDATNLVEVLNKCNPETTLFIVASKTFTTQETLNNANSAKNWLLANIPEEQKRLAISHHFIAVTAKPDRANSFGIYSDNIYPFWDWVGGRYSVWCAIGLSVAIAIGMENFYDFLRGANNMDEHFKNQPLDKNMPVIMAVLGIWNGNFWNTTSQAVISYDQYLNLLPSYLQQLEMESNGKHVCIYGEELNYATSPVIWGGVGTNGQHAYHQLLMQGTQIIPVDFIFAKETHNQIGEHHKLLVANCLAQSQALMQGKTYDEVYTELLAQGLSEQEATKLTPHKVISGNIPSTTIMLNKLTPKSLGALLALYEHKVFVQGIIWGINSFDQWGVELGKQLANNITQLLNKPILSANDLNQLDASTKGLIAKFNN